MARLRDYGHEDHGHRTDCKGRQHRQQKLDLNGSNKRTISKTAIALISHQFRFIIRFSMREPNYSEAVNHSMSDMEIYGTTDLRLSPQPPVARWHFANRLGVIRDISDALDLNAFPLRLTAELTRIARVARVTNDESAVVLPGKFN